MMKVRLLLLSSWSFLFFLSECYGAEEFFLQERLLVYI